MSPEQDLMLSEVLHEVVEYEYRALRGVGVDSSAAQVIAKTRVREALYGLLLDRLDNDPWS